ncbi:DUF2182 domain-containing protein [Pseudovibrio exalbescens]|uniref:Metal-binding protein n=1 Tax=Pseudovibrio exalbescens TaxID=197461 RepID=A0A1U7JFB0_9HYPH|nr:DUF2182 domain-containing protein [Pseudovibrio exalbescens]OKL43429.1 metal-binding protein [Pseudovibrio exalbescens]
MGNDVSSSQRFWRDAVPVLVLTGAIALGWAYLGYMVVDMVTRMDMGAMGPGMELFNQFNMFKGLDPAIRAQLAVLCLPMANEAFGMPGLVDGSFADFLLIFLMWLMMVLAMMLPSAVPMLTSYHRARPGNAVLVVAAGYLAIWTGFSVLATLLQMALHTLGALTPMMVPTISILATSTIFAAGIYQFTPFKMACLVRCRVPNTLLAGHKAQSDHSAFRFGLDQGLYCLGCCWALMALMFAVGIMNIIWIALLGLVMAIEKTSNSRPVTYGIGVALILWGAVNLYFNSGSTPFMNALAGLFTL